MSKEIYKLAGLATIFAGVGGVLYTTHKDTLIRQETAKLEHERTMAQQELEWERLELDKYDLGLPSKYDSLINPQVKKETPVSDYLANKSSNDLFKQYPDVINKFDGSANSPLEDFVLKNKSLTGLFPSSSDPMNFVSTDVVNYAGITILGCVLTISSAITMLYLNHLTLQYTDDNIDKAPKIVQMFYDVYKHSLSFNSNLLKLLVFTCSLLLISIGIYLTTV